MRHAHKVYTLLEAARQRVLRRRWRTPAQQAEATLLEVELYTYEEALLAGRSLPDLGDVDRTPKDAP